ncbi:MAG: hydroxyacylglutathione hydrolase [SAR324 cluster bacterium]|nr:hydroxyacylglutathione hydrolase [SAR324 cluster bacterium]
MKIVTIPCLQDNFAYLLICKKTKEAAVVDPSEQAPVRKAVEQDGVKLTTILNTHHHWDHVGGNKELKSDCPDLKIYGHASDRGRIPEQTEFLEDDDQVQFGEQSGSFLHNPGHTSGAITYLFGKTAFTGDTLFAAGCGRLFEGTPEQMYDSLNNRIGKLTDRTELYFGHEYTENNLRFALSVESGNKEINKKLADIKVLRSSGKFSTPTTISEEKQTNPFLRCTTSEIKDTVKSRDPDNDLTEKEVFRKLRELKDVF